MDKNIGVFVGSLRKESFNRKMAKALIALAPKSLKFKFIEIGHLPLYNQDFDDISPQPAEWTKLREEVRSSDGILFVTPEYNRSVPGVLKNAIDIASRPYGQSAWDGKPGAVITVSPGAIGGFGANHHLRQALVFLNVPTLQAPESYIGQAEKLFKENGEIANDATRDYLQKFINSFADWVDTISKSCKKK